MQHVNIATLLLTGFTFYVSYKGFKDQRYFDRYAFTTYGVLADKEYRRLITSGFLHTTWMHLIFNMVAFQSFGGFMEEIAGIPLFLLLYFGSMIGGSLLALFIHRNKNSYTAVGASGGVSGLVFASIGLFPSDKISIFFLPSSIPGWAFGLLYVLYCMYGIRSQRDNIGHEAHLGGGLVGLAIALAIFPEYISFNIFPILLITIPSAIFLYLIFTKSDFLLVNNPFSRNKGLFTKEDNYNASRLARERELDALLDKISSSGIESLTDKERRRLEQLSKPQ